MLKQLCLVAFLVIALGAFAAETSNSAGAGWPKSIVADVGDLQVRFESRSFWTLYRVDYRGDRLGIDRFGSHYGTVANFPEIGFIGSGHTENEDERVLSVALWVDGEKCPKPEEAIQGKSVRLHKRSRIKTLLIETDITIEGNRIIEDVTLSATEPTPVNKIYHFMHPWTATATEFAAERTDGEQVTGTFNGAKDFKVDAPTRWSAVYDRPTGKGAAIIVLDTPEGQPWKTWYWDIDKRYRKHYMVTFLNSTIPAEKRFHYRIAVVPFAADAETWTERVTGICLDVLNEEKK